MNAQRLGAVAFAALVVFVGSGDPDAGWVLPPAQTTEDPPAVLVFGDSITKLANDDGALADAFHDRGWQAQIHATYGATIADGYRYQWPTAIDPGRADVVVIAMGTNDAHDGWTAPARSRWWLDQWTAALPADVCVVTVGVNEGAARWGLDVTGPPLNAELEEVGDVFVAWAPDAAWVQADDGVHPDNETGRGAYRAGIVAGVEACL